MYIIKHCIYFYGLDQFGITIDVNKAIKFNNYKDAYNKLILLTSYLAFFDNFNIVKI